MRSVAEGAVGAPMANEAVAVAKTVCSIAVQCPPSATVVEWGRTPMTLHTGCLLMAGAASTPIEARNGPVAANSKECSMAAR